jgi:ribosomal protein S17E
MGKSIPKGVKIRAETLLEEVPELFSMDFGKNKLAINDLKLPIYKSNRNLISGYIVRLLKEREAQKI